MKCSIDNCSKMSERSQNQRILQALKFGRKLTPMAALRLFGCMRLAARIYELRQQGYTIIADSIEVNGKRFRCYWLA
jgi:hypothetical protein